MQQHNGIAAIAGKRMNRCELARRLHAQCVNCDNLFYCRTESWSINQDSHGKCDCFIERVLHMDVKMLAKAKPILFSTAMVQAILDGRKTQTRRIIKPQPIAHYDETCDAPGWYDTGGNNWACEKCGGEIQPFTGKSRIKSRYITDDILWVRETWYYENHMHDLTAGEPDLPSGAYSRRYIFRAECPEYPVNLGVGGNGWKPSIHMPREAARLFLRVTGVRAERLQDIMKYPSGPDNPVVKEGFTYGCDFIATWENLNAKRDGGIYAWDQNPWVWVYTFERIAGQ